jgi:hypothetical protein
MLKLIDCLIDQSGDDRVEAEMPRTEGPRAGRGRAARFVLLVVLVVICGFSFGWRTARRGRFPHPQLMAVADLFRGESAGDKAFPDAPPGRFAPWRADGRAAGPAEDQAAEAERLAGLGYPPGSSPIAAVWGVTLHDPDSAHAGRNLVVSGHGPAAFLIDMEGRVLHAWSRDFAGVWPDSVAALDDPGAHYWSHAHALPNGDLLAIHDGHGLVRLDANSDLVWSYPGAVHDDLFVAGDGMVYTIERENRTVGRASMERPIVGDRISVLDPTGRLVRSISIVDALRRSPYAPLLQRARRDSSFNTNSIEILDGRLGDAAPAFRAGNALVNLSGIDVLAVVDLEAEEIVWALTGRGDRIGGTSPLDGGRMLHFISGAGRSENGAPRSEVVEIDPLTQETLWSYAGDDERPLSSATAGSCQRLGNGNTLIAESDNGRAFEVTSEGAIVWEFINPYRAGPSCELIASLIEVIRLPASFGADWSGGES